MREERRAMGEERSTKNFIVKSVSVRSGGLV